MLKKITLNIFGMHCASCAANIENAFKKEPGVISININYANEKALLEIDDSKINLQEIQEKIIKLGYKSEQEKMEHRSHGYHSHADVEKKSEINKLRNQFIFSLIIGLPLIYIAMGDLIGLPIPSFFENYLIYIQFILATAVIIVCFKIWIRGFKALFRFQPDMDSLVFIGTATAYFYSLIVSIISLTNKNFQMSELYYESSVFILIFITLGDYLETITKGKTSQAIKKLIGLSPKETTIIKNNQEIKIKTIDAKVNDIILIKPGEKIPVDGIITKGFSTIDEKAITGESIPVEKKQGDKIIAGTINKTGSFQFQATKVGNDTMLSQIIRIVEQAMGSKAPIQELADKVSFYFVPVVIIIAIIALIIWLIVGHTLAFSLTIFVAVLIVACPCALGLATPVAVMMGTGLAAQNGILIRSGKALEIANRINMIVFDKTGTLTLGKLKVQSIIKNTQYNFSEEQILKIAGSIAQFSNHPISKATIDYARSKQIKLEEFNNFKEIQGKGVIAYCPTHDLPAIVGNTKMLADQGLDTAWANSMTSKYAHKGIIVFVGHHNKEVMGAIVIADEIRKETPDVISKFKKMGIKIAMITGDNKETANNIAQQIGIKNISAEILPQDKLQEIKNFQQQGNVVSMVGDGINDAPALAQANLGIALGSGTDVAIETGEIILIKNDLRDVLKAIDLSSYTLRKIKQGLFWAFIYNIIGIPIAAGILYPFTGWLLSPMIAAAAMAFSSVSVVLNALLMKGYKTK